MISVKGGTKTWSDSTQQSSLKKDTASTISSSDKDEKLGGQEVGEVLNKASDPNWVDPAKKLRQVGNNKLDKDAFLNLLLAQMKNQDPTNPLKSHEMAAQLAQFTSLEKLSNIDAGIEKLSKAQTPNQNFEALNFIGKMVAGDGAKIQRTDTEGGHDIKFHIMNDAQVAKVDIKNADGEVVRSLTFNNLKAGKNEVFWNGTLEDGTPARVGEYTAEIDATGSNGAKLHAETQFQGKITGVNFTSAGPVLMIGKTQIAMKDVTEIVDPASQAPAQPLMPQGLTPEMMKQLQAKAANAMPAPAAAKAAPAKPQVKPEADKKPVSTGPNNLENVAMSRDMINKLNREGAETGM
jgi:flagellar basal-body rod modification protein FlgD